VWVGLVSRWNVFERLHSRLLVKRNDQIESGGTKLKMCSTISAGMVMSDAGVLGASAIDSASINMRISDNDSRDMMIMSVVLSMLTNAVCVDYCRRRSRRIVFPKIRHETSQS